MPSLNEVPVRDVRQRKLVAVALSLALAAGAALVSSSGCNGTGVTPVCAYPDGAYDPESGCGQPVEAAVTEDSAVDQSSPSEDAGVDSTSPSTSDSGDSGKEMDATDAEKAVDGDAGEHDAHITDAHADAKG